MLNEYRNANQEQQQANDVCLQRPMIVVAHGAHARSLNNSRTSGLAVPRQNAKSANKRNCKRHVDPKVLATPKVLDAIAMFTIVMRPREPRNQSSVDTAGSVRIKPA